MARNPQVDDRLGDYTADARLITLSVMAALVGVISAFVALALVRLIGLFTNLAYFHRFATSLVSPAASGPGLWSLPIPVVGGLIVGLLARYGSEKIRGHGIPEAMEAILIGRSRIEARVAVLKPLSSAIAIGYDVIHDLVAGRLVGIFLLVLLVVKALIWAIGLGSGTSGGVLAPLLVMGGTMGALGASALHRPDPGLWAMVGMAALMGGTMQVPLTAVIFVLELTGDFAALPGLLIGSIAAAGVTVLLMRRSILTEKLARRGRHVTREYGVNPLHVLRVEDVMEPPLAPRTASVAPVVVYPDELLETAMRKLLEHKVEVLPVASPDDPGRVVGYVERSAILGAWVQHTRDEHTREEGWLGRLRRASR